MGTSVERSSAITDLYSRACSYRMHGERVDGMNLFAVREVAERIIPQVRKTQRPVLLEAVTYRYRGHGAADAAKYRTPEEVEEWKQRDPIGIVETRLLTEKALTQKDVERIHEEVNAEIDDCLKFAEESDFPSPDALYDHIYA
jgi:pyruvate dehydrogenase E1 component alpha subunit